MQGLDCGSVLLVIFATHAAKKAINPICGQFAWLYKLVKKAAVVWPQVAKNTQILISTLRFTLFDPCCKDH